MRNVIHNIKIPTIMQVEFNALSNVGELLKKNEFKKILVITDTFVKEHFYPKMEASFFKWQEVEVKIIEKEEISDIVLIAFTQIKTVDVIIGIGGGRVVDIGKYIAYLKQIPYISIPTTASNDGFSSPTVSLPVNGKLQTIQATIPYGIIIDLTIVKDAPDMFLLSGIGDLISNITAIKDWEYEESQGFTMTDDFASMIAKKASNSILRTKLNLNDIKEEAVLKELMSSLAMDGIANEIAGTSAPVSGSEHLISHAMDRLLPKPYMHGLQVGLATYIMSVAIDYREYRIRELLIEIDFFDYIKSLKIPRTLIEEAIDLAKTIKPDRHTYLHDEKYIEKAKKVLVEDEILKNIWV